MGGVAETTAVPELKIYVGKVGWEKSVNIDSIRVDDVTILTTSNVMRQLEQFDIDRQGENSVSCQVSGGRRLSLQILQPQDSSGPTQAVREDIQSRSVTTSDVSRAERLPGTRNIVVSQA